jgi:hypothetical protein
MAVTLAELKLLYSDFSGGRRESARLGLNLAGIPFEGHRIPAAD